MRLLCTCLNPCFSGIWSRRMKKNLACFCSAAVLILVLVEFGLGVAYVDGICNLLNNVLILVLVEFGLGVDKKTAYSYKTRVVLILVLVEFGLGALTIRVCGISYLRS